MSKPKLSKDANGKAFIDRGEIDKTPPKSDQTKTQLDFQIDIYCSDKGNKEEARKNINNILNKIIDENPETQKDRVIKHSLHFTEGFNPIILAILANNLDAVREFIRAGFSINGTNPKKFDESLLTPLHYAISLGNHNLIMNLLKYGADPDKANADNESPLVWALKQAEPNRDIINSLLYYGARITGDFPVINKDRHKQTWHRQITKIMTMPPSIKRLKKFVIFFHKVMARYFEENPEDGLITFQILLNSDIEINGVKYEGVADLLAKQNDVEFLKEIIKVGARMDLAENRSSDIAVDLKDDDKKSRPLLSPETLKFKEDLQKENDYLRKLLFDSNSAVVTNAFLIHAKLDRQKLLSGRRTEQITATDLSNPGQKIPKKEEGNDFFDEVFADFKDYNYESDSKKPETTKADLKDNSSDEAVNIHQAKAPSSVAHQPFYNQLPSTAKQR